MTIAACYLSPEGVVMGADSTASTMVDPGGFHYFNHSQKLFEIGENSTIGVLMWGLGGLAVSSHRWLLALFADELAANPPKTIAEVADRWRDKFWQAYTTTKPISDLIVQCQALDKKPPHGSKDAGARTEEEERNYQQLRLGLFTGFCIGGYLLPDRVPAAFVISFDPLGGKPTPVGMAMGAWGFWGAPNMIQRLIFGCDDGLQAEILNSGLWKGTPQDLNALVQRHQLLHPILPIRDAIDFVHACITSTIKAMKFSSFSQICGGPIEVAVITTDRKFRWVRHKPWDAAITDGEP